MVNLPPIGGINQPNSPVVKRTNRRVGASTGTAKREGQFIERRRSAERRSRRGQSQIMDRRCGSDRRRSGIYYRV